MMMDLILGLCGSVIVLCICYGLAKYETRSNKKKKNV